MRQRHLRAVRPDQAVLHRARAVSGPTAPPQLLATTTEADRQARTRNRCNGEGYESVALIPLRLGHERLGLLQLNDRRQGRFSPELISLWERLAGHLAVALAKFRADEALRESEARFRSLFENMQEGFAYCRMVFEQGRPRDFVYLHVNEAFESLTGLKDVIGRKVSEVIPGIRESDPLFFEIYGRVARPGGRRSSRPMSRLEDVVLDLGLLSRPRALCRGL